MMTNSRARGRAREARAMVMGRASREGTRRNVRPDAPNKNYVEHNTLIVNKRQTTRAVA